MENKDIRLKAKGAGVPLWAIARELRISEPTMTRKLRVPLDEEEKKRILNIIEKLSEG